MLKKLSLAALIAMGSMSVATATPLTEAIKGVDTSGEMKLKFTYDDNGAGWETSGKFKFAVPVSEELKLKTSYKFESKKEDNLKNSKLFLEYSRDQLKVSFGKLPVDTPITDKDTGTGLIATYKAMDNLTFAAAGLDTLKDSDNNVIALGAIYGMDNLNLQGWFFTQSDKIKSDIVVTGSYKMDIVKINGDIAMATLEGNDKGQSYFNISAEGKVEGFSVMAGFAKTGKDGGTVVLNEDAPISAVLPTKQIGNIANSADATAIYAKVGSNIDSKINVYVAFANISGLDDDDDNTLKNDYTEIAFGGSYKYTKKMKLSAYYSILSGSGDAKEKDNNKLSLEAKYSF